MTHSDKALTTFAKMDTVGTDWFHPAINWVEEKRLVPGYVTCPSCAGHKWVRRDAEGKLLPLPPKPIFNKTTYTHKGQKEWDTYFQAARAEHAAKNGGFAGYNGNCPTCAQRRRGWGLIATGHVKGLVMADVMVGHVVWPKGAKPQHNFSGGNHIQCQVCGKGVPSGRRVPMAHEKDGKALSMWVGEDCARKFSNVAVLKPSKTVNPKGREAVLKDNLEYIVKEA